MNPVRLMVPSHVSAEVLALGVAMGVGEFDSVVELTAPMVDGAPCVELPLLHAPNVRTTTDDRIRILWARSPWMGTSH